MTIEDTVRIPLFPLPIVVLPGEAVSLHIFEERYQRLVADMEPLGALGVFGISLVQPHGIAAVGCGVRIERFIQRYENGRSDILIRGAMRYTLRETYDEKPYLEARVLPLNDELKDEPVSPLREQVITLHARYSEIMTGRPVVQTAETRPPLSFVLSSVAQMSKETKQQILETRTEQRRLEILVAHYQSAIAEASPKAEIARITGSNGIMKH